MDISSWPLDRVMQLPDHCFGRRWPVAVAGYGKDLDVVYATTMASLPERCVIWEIWLPRLFVTDLYVDWVFRLGDQVPANAAEFDVLEYLFPDIYGNIQGRSAVRSTHTNTYRQNKLRMPVLSSGRKIVAELTISAVVANLWFQAIFVISSVPRSIEWPNSV